MDSPRGRVYQMVQVAERRAHQPVLHGAHRAVPGLPRVRNGVSLRACSTAAWWRRARAEIEAQTVRPWHARLFRRFIFGHLLQSPRAADARRRAAVSVRSQRIEETRPRRWGSSSCSGAWATWSSSSPPARAAVLLQPGGQNISGRRRAALPGGVPGGLYRQHLLRAAERGHGARACRRTAARWCCPTSRAAAARCTSTPG